MRDTVKRLALAGMLVASGALLLAAPTKTAPLGSQSCDCDEFTSMIPCSVGGTVPDGTFVCNDDGMGAVCVEGNWVECYFDRDDPSCDNGKNYWECSELEY